MVSEFYEGSQVYKYVLKRNLGAGCFGEVWLAHDDTINKDVAIKMIRQSGPLTMDKFKEAWIGNRFDHPNLIKVHYADVVKVASGNLYFIIVMDFLAAGAITGRLNSRGFMPLPDTLHVMRNVLFGLDHLHRAQFFHNDIKPSNILIGHMGQAVISDYGVTRQPGETTDLQCYYLHRAPEIYAGKDASVQTDLYQSGLTMYRLLCGDGVLGRYWQEVGETNYIKAVMGGSLVSDKVFPDYVPTRVRSIIKKAVAVNPEERFHSAIQMQQELEKLSYPGFWTADENDMLIGRKSATDNVYLFEEGAVGGGLYQFTAKIRYPSGKVNKLGRFCKTKINQKDLVKIRRMYIKWVVEE